MTREQYEKLVPYERTLMNAYKNNFVYMPATDFSKVAEIFAEVFSKPLTKSQMGCNTCRLNALKKLGEEYSKFKSEMENTNTTSKPEIKTNKSGRPKKLV